MFFPKRNHSSKNIVKFPYQRRQSPGDLVIRVLVNINVPFCVLCCSTVLGMILKNNRELIFYSPRINFSRPLHVTLCLPEENQKSVIANSVQ